MCHKEAEGKVYGNTGLRFASLRSHQGFTDLSHIRAESGSSQVPQQQVLRRYS